MKRSSFVTHLSAAAPVVALCVGVAIVSLGLAGRSPGLDQAIIIALIDLVMVTGLYVFVGNSGVVSFGQVGFMAIGAYVCGMLTIPDIAKSTIIPNAPEVFRATTLGSTAGIVVGAVVAALVAFIVSIPLTRLSGIGASIGTLAFLLIVHTFFANWKPGTSGGGNLTRVPTDTTVNSALVWALAALVLAFAYQRTRFGLRLRAAREDEIAARAVGVSLGRERRIAFTISALLFGIGGGLYGHAIGSFSADDFYLQVTFITLAMLVVGGMLSLFGAVIGTTLVAAVSYVFDQWQNDDPVLGLAIHMPAGTRNLVVAAVLLLVLLLRPDGLTGGREVALPTGLRRPRTAPASEPTTSEPDVPHPTPR